MKPNSFHFDPEQDPGRPLYHLSYPGLIYYEITTGAGGAPAMGRACVIGSGPNGLTAAIVLARAGIETTIFEAERQIGGGARSAALTLPGFLHDVCSAVHPLAASSPAFASFPLADHGLEWIEPPIALAHPLPDGSAVALERSLDATCARLGSDGPRYHGLMEPLARHWEELAYDILGPPRVPNRLFTAARFGLLAPWPAAPEARLLFRSEPARALFAGLAAHSLLPLDAPGSSAFAWVLAAGAHHAGWPIPRGGAQRIADALASYFADLGGKIETGVRVRSLRELAHADILLCDVTPRQFLQLAPGRLPDSFRRRLERYRYGPGVFKLDWALASPIPWRAPECVRAGTVHLGGTLDEIAGAERAVAHSAVPPRPFVLLSQPSLFDPARAPQGSHTALAYCHVPRGSTADMAEAIEKQVERFAPGFRETVLARHVLTPAELERHNANLVGGDIGGGSNELKQLLFRPTGMYYRTPLRGVYLCSSSTPPGAGVHGMCGFHAARAALRDARILRR